MISERHRAEPQLIQVSRGPCLASPHNLSLIGWFKPNQGMASVSLKMKCPCCVWSSNLHLWSTKWGFITQQPVSKHPACVGQGHPLSGTWTLTPGSSQCGHTQGLLMPARGGLLPKGTGLASKALTPHRLLYRPGLFVTGPLPGRWSGAQTFACCLFS